jgi:glutaredoxin
LSDFWPHGRVAHRYGVLRSEGFSERAIFVIDRNGIICHAKVYDQDEQPDNQELWDVLANINPDAVPLPLPVEKEEEELPHGGIVMYCTPWCPDCRRARNWMADRGLEYIEVNTNESRAGAAQARLWGKGYKISPTFDIDGEIILDFNTDRLVQVLKEKNYL